MIPRGVAVLFALLLWTGAAAAHGSSTSYVVVNAANSDVAVTWSLSLRDLEDAIGIDQNGDGILTWDEVRSQKTRIDAYALTRLRISTAGATCMPRDPPAHAIDDLGDGAYLVLNFQLRCPVPIGQLDVTYDALFEVDPQHRGLVNVTLNGIAQGAVMSPGGRSVGFGKEPSIAAFATAFFTGGVSHLLGGADHVLFIVVLLAPALLRPRAVDSSWARLIEVVRLLTAFTVAHACALTLAVIGVVAVPARLAEAAIALTILVTALDNIWPFLPGRRWILALGFGLIHGLGVAGGLGPLHLPPMMLALALIAFNLGLEAVQIAIAVVATPAAIVLRAAHGASWRLLPLLSGAAACAALIWLMQRTGYSWSALAGGLF